MPLAKSADVFTEAPKSAPVEMSVPGKGAKFVHPEVLRYFDLQPATASMDKLQTINDWAFEGAANTAHAIQKINQLQSKIGASTMGEAALSKLSNYVRMNRAVNYTQQQLSKELDSFTSRRKELEVQIDQTQSSKVAELEKKLSQARLDHKRAMRNWQLQGNMQTKNIKDRYAKEINELSTLRKVYGGKK